MKPPSLPLAAALVVAVLLLAWSVATSHSTVHEFCTEVLHGEMVSARSGEVCLRDGEIVYPRSDRFFVLDQEIENG